MNSHTMNMVYLALWAATIPLIPHALWRKKYDTLATLVIIFLLLSFNILIIWTTPNPDHMIFIQVVE